MKWLQQHTVAYKSTCIVLDSLCRKKPMADGKRNMGRWTSRATMLEIQPMSPQISPKHIMVLTANTAATHIHKETGKNKGRTVGKRG